MIVVVGSLNMDLVINTDFIPRPGETVLGNDFNKFQEEEERIRLTQLPNLERCLYGWKSRSG